MMLTQDDMCQIWPEVNILWGLKGSKWWIRYVRVNILWFASNADLGPLTIRAKHTWVFTKRAKHTWMFTKESKCQHLNRHTWGEKSWAKALILGGGVWSVIMLHFCKLFTTQKWYCYYQNHQRCVGEAPVPENLCRWFIQSIEIRNSNVLKLSNHFKLYDLR